MAKLFAPPKLPRITSAQATAPLPPPVLDAGAGADPVVTNTDRLRALEGATARQSRGRTGTVATSLRGALLLPILPSERKRLLGE